jgi:hypothetical protein
MAAKKKTKTINKSASTGKFVKTNTVERHPSKTVKQSTKVTRKKKPTK